MKHNFKPYLNPIFIETGSYIGDGIQAALRAHDKDIRFEKIISIEVSKHFYDICKARFSQGKVQLYFGDSILVLPEVLKTIDKRCTFWLDAHYMGDPNTEGGMMWVPLMEELKIIAKHHIKNHTILIDDIRLLRDHEAEWKDFPYCVCDVEEFIHTINPNYKITYTFGVVAGDILIAQV